VCGEHVVDHRVDRRPRELRLGDHQRGGAVHAHPEADRGEEGIGAAPEQTGVEAPLHVLEEVLERRRLRQLLGLPHRRREGGLAHEHDPVVLGVLEREADVGLAPPAQHVQRVEPLVGGRLRRSSSAANWRSHTSNSSSDLSLKCR
jgi:hypothetical protein